MVETPCAGEINYPRGRFRFVIVSFLLLVVVNPYIEGFTRISFFSDIFFASILISLAYSVSHEKSMTVLAVLLALPAVVPLALKNMVKSPGVVLTGNIFGILFIGFTILLILSFIARQKEVTTDVLHAAIVVYLLMGMMWSLIYRVVEAFEPGSFKGAAGEIAGRSPEFIYYSFVTLTTLGYGDITPVTSKAYAFTILEAVVGQIYLVVQVAWLVGMFTARSLDQKAAERSAAGESGETPVSGKSDPGAEACETTDKRI